MSRNQSTGMCLKAPQCVSDNKEMCPGMSRRPCENPASESRRLFCHQHVHSEEAQWVPRPSTASPTATPCKSWRVVGAHRELLGKHASERREFTSETQSYFSISLFSSGDKTGYSLIYSHLNTNPSRDTCMPSKLPIPRNGKAACNLAGGSGARRYPWGLARRCPWSVARRWWMLTSRWPHFNSTGRPGTAWWVGRLEDSGKFKLFYHSFSEENYWFVSWLVSSGSRGEIPSLKSLT